MLDPLPAAATFSKDSRMWGADFTPKCLLRGEGARVLGDDEHWYTDWVGGLGANLLGYGHHDFMYRVSNQVLLGIAYSLPHRLERQVAEKLVRLLGKRVLGWSPEGLQVRFGKTGSDVTEMAVRLARAVTGKFHLVRFGYAGWHSWTVSTTPPAWGIIPEEANYVHEFTFNDRASVEKWGDLSIAAVILEQPPQEPEPGWYDFLHEFCLRKDALLILDEIVTGFRYALGGAAEYYKVQPDLACYGKALGNGLPISALVGRREYMAWFGREDPVFCSGTHFGEAVGLAAADAVLDFYGETERQHIWQVGQELLDGLRAAGWTVAGNAPRSLMQFTSDAERAFFIVSMRNRGILMNRPNFPNLAHTDADVRLTTAVALDVRKQVDALGPDGMAQRMAGKLPRVLFRNR